MPLYRYLMFRRAIGEDAEVVMLDERHAAELFELIVCSRDHLRLWLPWVDDTCTPADSLDFILRSLEQHALGESLVTGIWQGGRLAGVASLVAINPANRSATIGYWVGAEHEGKGLVTRACVALIDHAFGDLGLNRVVIRAATGNRRSRAVPERLGFALEGVERQAEWVNDRFVDMAVYSVLREEWFSRAGPSRPRSTRA